jgi:hypothetical protein
MSKARKHGTRSRRERHEEAVERNTNFASLSFKDQLGYIDLRLGEGVGATKQRARIQTKIDLPQATEQKKAKQKKRAKKNK